MTTDQLLELQIDTFEHCAGILERKNHDYSGSSEDALSNFKAASALGMHPLSGLLLRIQDKLQRLKTYAECDYLIDGDSAFDACDDIINYAVLAKGLIIDGKEDVLDRVFDALDELDCCNDCPSYRPICDDEDDEDDGIYVCDLCGEIGEEAPKSGVRITITGI